MSAVIVAAAASVVSAAAAASRAAAISPAGALSNSAMVTSYDESEKLTGAGDAATWGVGAVPVIAMVARKPSVRTPARIAGRRRARRAACRRLRRAEIGDVFVRITPVPD